MRKRRRKFNGKLALLKLIHGLAQALVCIFISGIIALGLVWGFNEEAKLSHEVSESWLNE